MQLARWCEMAAMVSALLSFALAAYNVPARPNLIALGLFLVTLGLILAGFGR